MTTPPTVVGLDLSLTATGVASRDVTDIIAPGNLRDEPRILHLLDQILAVTRHADLVVIEGLSYGSTGGKALERGGLHWAVRISLHRLRRPFAIVPPSSLKKWATGKGNAGKVDMGVAYARRRGIDPTDDNVTDAWFLMAMGHEHLGDPVVAMPASHRQALDKVTWPAPSTHRRPTAATTRST